MRYPNGVKIVLTAEDAETLTREVDELRAIIGKDVTLADLVLCAPAMAKKLYQLNYLDVAEYDEPSN